jgi:hypothetical protein
MSWVDGKGSVAGAEAPASPAGWATERIEQSARRAARAGAGPADPEARARRRQQRIERMSTGLAELERWLEDQVTHGLASTRQQPYPWWDQVAGRLVDSQLPALAERVRTMAGAVHAEQDWASHLLLEVGRWHLATQAWQRRDELSASEAADLRAYLGWARPTDEVVDRAAGRWQVVGVHRTEEGRLAEQRTWLTDLASGCTVVALDFAAVGGTLRVAHVVGTVVTGELGRYPGSPPSRVLVPGPIEASGRRADLPGLGSIDEALAVRAEQVAANPWLERTPAALGDVHLALVADGTVHVVDAVRRSLPLTPDTDRWTLLALAGPDRVAMFAELDDGGVRPLTLAIGGELVAV